LTTSWGVEMHPVGKTVWAEIIGGLPGSWESDEGAGSSVAVPAPAPAQQLSDSALQWSMVAGTDAVGSAER
ncbi:MAG: hypothetical protein ACRDRV_21450, partial [Pseudonocardiaceae bacterium]